MGRKTWWKLAYSVIYMDNLAWRAKWLTGQLDANCPGQRGYGQHQEELQLQNGIPLQPSVHFLPETQLIQP